MKQLIHSAILLTLLALAFNYDRQGWVVSGETKPMSKKEAYQEAMEYGADYIQNIETQEKCYTGAK